MGRAEEPLRVTQLRDLGAMDLIPVGAQVHVEEDGITYTSVGQTTPEIIERVGWSQSNIWMPGHVKTSILFKHEVFPDPLAAAQAMANTPLSVHKDRRGPGFVYFFMLAQSLREAGLLTSRSTDFVDGVVELRRVSGGNVLRC